MLALVEEPGFVPQFSTASLSGPAGWLFNSSESLELGRFKRVVYSRGAVAGVFVSPISLSGL